MATYSSILTWRIPWAEEPGGLHTVHEVTKSQPQLSDWAHNCFTVLVSAVQQSESAVCIHMAPPPWTSLPHRAQHSVMILHVILKQSRNLALFVCLFPCILWNSKSFLVSSQKGNRKRGAWLWDLALRQESPPEWRWTVGMDARHKDLEVWCTRDIGPQSLGCWSVRLAVSQMSWKPQQEPWRLIY